MFNHSKQSKEAIKNEFIACTKVNYDVLEAMRQPAYRLKHNIAFTNWVIKGANFKINALRAS